MGMLMFSTWNLPVQPSYVHSRYNDSLKTLARNDEHQGCLTSVWVISLCANLSLSECVLCCCSPMISGGRLYYESDFTYPLIDAGGEQTSGNELNRICRKRMGVEGVAGVGGQRGIKAVTTLLNVSIKSFWGAASLVALARVSSDFSLKKDQSEYQSGGAGRARSVCEWLEKGRERVGGEGGAGAASGIHITAAWKATTLALIH